MNARKDQWTNRLTDGWTDEGTHGRSDEQTNGHALPNSTSSQNMHRKGPVLHSPFPPHLLLLDYGAHSKIVAGQEPHRNVNTPKEADHFLGLQGPGWSRMQDAPGRTDSGCTREPGTMFNT